MSEEHNATFHAFKQSGKWYTTTRGYLSETIFHTYDLSHRRSQNDSILLDRLPHRGQPAANSDDAGSSEELRDEEWLED